MSVMIEEGRYYGRRDGVVVGPTKRNPYGNYYPWAIGENNYSEFGVAWGPLHRSSLDLIREVPNPNAPAHSTLIFGAVVPGHEPVPVPEKVERVLWEGVPETRHLVLGYDVPGKRIRIVEIGE